jgi:hypothetical protein
MTTKEHAFDLVLRRLGRDSEEASDVVTPLHANFWAEAANVLAERSYEHRGSKIHVRVNWAPLAKRILRDHKIMEPVRAGQSNSADWYKKVSRSLRLKATCSIEGSNDLAEMRWYPGFFVEYFLHEVFLVGNLACPGSADFFRASIERKLVTHTTEPHLSAYQFDDWLVETMSGAEPAARLLGVEETAAWVFRVNPSVTQKADTSTQRALFALYQLCKVESSIDAVLWTFHALESLLSTRVGENFSGLVRRASLVLQLSPKQSAQVSKNLRKLYDLRSAFIHGGLDTPHPMQYETIDPRLDDQYEKFREPVRHGFYLLAALLQRMIDDGRENLLFEEKLVRVPDAI